MSSIKLSQGTLGAIASSGITVPRYSRDTLAEKPAIVHLGVGGFHRSHMALYTCEALKHPEAQAGSWAICGVGVMPGDASMRDALRSQDCLYTVLSRGLNSNEAQVCGAIVKYLLAPDDPEAVLDQMLSTATKIVSLTITEKGYCASDLGAMKLDVTHPFVVHDTTNPESPKSALGFIVTALSRRRAAGRPPFTVLSCDNLQGNGTTARTLTLAMAAAMAPALGAAGEG